MPTEIEVTWLDSSLLFCLPPCASHPSFPLQLPVLVCLSLPLSSLAFLPLSAFTIFSLLLFIVRLSFLSRPFICLICPPLSLHPWSVLLAHNISFSVFVPPCFSPLNSVWMSACLPFPIHFSLCIPTLLASTCSSVIRSVLLVSMAMSRGVSSNLLRRWASAPYLGRSSATSLWLYPAAQCSAGIFSMLMPFCTDAWRPRVVRQGIKEMRDERDVMTKDGCD